MPPKQRQIRIEQRGSLAAIQQLESRSDEELQRETKHRAAALALLGARAADRYDSAAARRYFQQAIAAAHPRERMHLKRMADASLALAERRADDLKQAVEKLGGEAPSGRQLFALKMMGLIVPPPGASALVKLRGYATGLGLATALIAVGFGIVELISLPFGGIGIGGAILLGIVVVAAALGVLALFGRRRQRRARS